MNTTREEMIIKLLHMKEVEINIVKQLSNQWLLNREEIENLLEELRGNMQMLQKELNESELPLYPNRYQARKNRRFDEVTVSVEGGFVNIPYDEYKIWRKQR